MPDQLEDAHGNLVPTASILGGVVGLYFSAHWCPPCRGFTPVLSEWYKSFTEKNPDKKFHLVFVSSDRSEHDFKEYHKEMGFHALPFSQREKKAELSSKFGVRGIPTLVLLSATGEVLTKDGRSIVASDPEGAGYPWAPKSLADIMGSGPLINHDGASLEWSSLAGKHVSFYFSAHWCGPCRGFTPKLVEAYNSAKAAGKNWEVIFVSADNSDDEFEEYYGTMPFLALPHEDPRAAELNTFFEVEGIPTLVLVDPSGKVLTTELRGAIDDDPTAADFPWPRKAVTSLRGAAGEINDVPTLVFLTDGSAAQVAAGAAAVQPAADAELARGDAARLRFAVVQGTEADQEIAQQLLQLTGHAGEALPRAVLFNVPGGQRYDLAPEELTAEGVSGVVARFGDKSLKTIGLRG